jgi:hypothetical protein
MDDAISAPRRDDAISAPRRDDANRRPDPGDDNMAVARHWGLTEGKKMRKKGKHVWGTMLKKL